MGRRRKINANALIVAMVMARPGKRKRRSIALPLSSSHPVIQQQHAASMAHGSGACESSSGRPGGLQATPLLPEWDKRSRCRVAAREKPVIGTTLRQYKLFQSL